MRSIIYLALFATLTLSLPTELEKKDEATSQTAAKTCGTGTTEKIADRILNPNTTSSSSSPSSASANRYTPSSSFGSGLGAVKDKRENTNLANKLISIAKPAAVAVGLLSGKGKGKSSSGSWGGAGGGYGGGQGAGGGSNVDYYG
ncbi:hypothetical protein IFR05_009366, partial [Cadophora sp. M221]